MKYGPPKITKRWRGMVFVECPGYKEEMRVDDEQYHGRVSMDCPYCEYHKTHDLSCTDRSE